MPDPIRLKSNLALLATLSLEELINVQLDVTLLLEAKIKEIRAHPVIEEKEGPEASRASPFHEKEQSCTNFRLLNEAAKDDSFKHPNVLIEEDKNVPAGDDTENLILTQFDPETRDKLLNNHDLPVSIKLSFHLNLIRYTKNEEKNIRSVSPLSKTAIKCETDCSSPLKEPITLSQNDVQLRDDFPLDKRDLENMNYELDGEEAIADSISDLDFIQGIEKFEPTFKRPLNLIGENNAQKPNPKKLKRDSTKPNTNITPTFLNLDKKSTQKIPLVDFNTNPLTEKPWILEDFKPNENKAFIRRGRLKLENFYKKAGKPINLPANGKSDAFLDDSVNADNIEFQFDNLRQRAKSPPGFGRLDFPTTQERVDDKEKSQEIIQQKTRYRFLMAIQNNLPPQERRYIFKKEKLNRIVDGSQFSWSPSELKIYERKPRKRS
ncbi:ssDNA endodeoxyribonuclease SAE2 NDAI_0G03500 [Naumovozyma dairenensis CBS 421]|uniref:DNA endonuclease activator Ctp1 C-terminal domain-containing protein n=1 Tax=Naumovozyma dairenensis (strain ATCC 10597 / BCRC 20456 / CBS 421 / NBRC 0211 / NRRL Y-12639) TaxID=1071378 RepID=G0WEB6_NAUDC|nr:hypothetical protein NDAI_0G03500 [Naumovozyma dairenensis CBS 421]CCD26127.2 hypothetical protein NDAI_0G03500 [Naumovozyma dairenensis CBS 421]